MEEIGAHDLKTHTGQILDRVEVGERLTITRRGKAVALLTPLTVGFNRQDALDAIAEIRDLRRGITLGDGTTIKELISEGRM